MIAYNKEWLNNLLLRQEVDNAFDEQCMDESERDTLYKKYGVGFYSPNVFIRLGLFFLTLVIMLFSFGLMIMIFLRDADDMFRGILIFFGISSFVALELIVKRKRHYRSGVDDALLWGGACALYVGICGFDERSEVFYCILAFLVSIYGWLRFTDRLMAAVGLLSLLGIIFYTSLELGNIAKTIVPFIIMAASAGVYFSVKKLYEKKTAIHYRQCLEMISIIALISFYAAGNYYVVRELSITMFHLDLQPGQSIPFGWLFWIFTFTIPLLYIARGLQKKDIVLIRVGLLLVAAIVFTVRYYYHILPVELIMLLAGILLLAIGYALTKYLHEPKYGFTFQELSKKDAAGKLNIESLLLTQTFANGPEVPDTKFGGGSFGGGGTSADY